MLGLGGGRMKQISSLRSVRSNLTRHSRLASEDSLGCLPGNQERQRCTFSLSPPEFCKSSFSSSLEASSRGLHAPSGSCEIVDSWHARHTAQHKPVLHSPPPSPTEISRDISSSLCLARIGFLYHPTPTTTTTTTSPTASNAKDLHYVPGKQNHKTD